MKCDFKDKTAVVTGGASGIGRQLCILLAAKGCTVYAADCNDEENSRTAELAAGLPGSCRAVHLDVTDRNGVRSLAGRAVSETGTLDFFFNCAAVSVMGPALSIRSEQWDQVMEITFRGVLNGTLAALEIMMPQKHGSVINISSMAGFAPFALNAPYSAAKYAVSGMTEAIRCEAESQNVSIHLVYPGIINTPFYNSMEIVGAERSQVLGRFPSFIMMPEKAAERIISGLGRGRKVIIFPLHAKLLYYAVRFFPWIIPVMNRRLINVFSKISD